MTELTCFKAYDVRGKLGEEINEEIAYLIGRSFAQIQQAKSIAVGGDIRLTSEELKQALAKGIMEAGADVIDLGVTGTEEIYFASMFLDVDGGVEITASHNPIDYNGMKFIGKKANPIASEELRAIKHLAENKDFAKTKAKGKLSKTSILDDYIEHYLSYINLSKIAPLKLVINSGNGASGRVIDAIEKRFNELNLKVEFIKIHHEPDGTFPNGIPNPILPKNRQSTKDAVIKYNADFGIAFDGDFDRCFLFDERGEFIEGYYIVGLLAEVLLQKNPKGKIIYDPRLTWNTIDIVNRIGGTAIMSRTGHSFIKQAMRKENAIYGGEMSAHHYFRDFSYCDSGMIVWLLIMEHVSNKQQPLSKLVGERIKAYPCSGEINYKVKSSNRAMKRVLDHYRAGIDGELPIIDETDGISLAFSDWRFNLRSSNTEPLLRLNIEAKNDAELVKQRVTEIAALIDSE